MGLQGVNNQTSLVRSALMKRSEAKSNKPTGYIIDKSANLKKGEESVGVSRKCAGIRARLTIIKWLFMVHYAMKKIQQ